MPCYLRCTTWWHTLGKSKHLIVVLVMDRQHWGIIDTFCLRSPCKASTSFLWAARTAAANSALTGRMGPTRHRSTNQHSSQPHSASSAYNSHTPLLFIHLVLLRCVQKRYNFYWHHVSLCMCTWAHTHELNSATKPLWSSDKRKIRTLIVMLQYPYNVPVCMSTCNREGVMIQYCAVFSSAVLLNSSTRHKPVLTVLLQVHA